MSPGFAYGRILPVRIEEKPIPTLLCKTEGVAIKAAAIIKDRAFSKTLSFGCEEAFFGVIVLAMART